MQCGKVRLMPPKRPKTATGAAPLVQLSLFAEEANLARVYPEENMWRFYRMEIWPDLLGGALLMRQWGRRHGGAPAARSLPGRGRGAERPSGDRAG
jgi:hypothetical protein